jgi:hypothetical protein
MESQPWQFPSLNSVPEWAVNWQEGKPVTLSDLIGAIRQSRVDRESTDRSLLVMLYLLGAKDEREALDFAIETLENRVYSDAEHRRLYSCRSRRLGGVS